jgi:DMSO/TMAO reductase YedYZ molybdopterin-dependent catalytic subunit
MKSGFCLGLFVGLLLTAPLISILYLLHTIAGTPFTPFDFFDGLVRVLPGAVVTFGIDSMVRLLMFLGLDLSGSSKTLEQAQAIAIFLGIAAVAAGVFFSVLQNRSSRDTLLRGVILGTAVAVPVAALAGYGVWTLTTLIAWGMAVSGLRFRIAELNRTSVSPSSIVGAGARQPSLTSVDRRRFLVTLGGASAGITVVGAILSETLRTSRSEPVVEATSSVALPDRPGAVMPAPGTRPEYTPVRDHYRIDINLRPMKVDGETWRLPINGLVDRPLNLTLSDFRDNRHTQHLFVTLACISNPVGGNLIGTTQWSGVSVKRVLQEARVREQARFLKLTAADGFHESVPLDLIDSDERVMFTHSWDGKPLTTVHGFPLRIYIPDRYGMKQPKWITNAELIAKDEPGYWVVRGWDRTASMKAASVIDTVAVDSAIQKDGQMLVPIGGMAHAGARGISRVELQVDDGPWLRAAIRTPLSNLTWVLWRYDWPFQSGRHIFRVRCYEGDGVQQIETPQEPHPSGASGLFTLHRNL